MREGGLHALEGVKATVLTSAHHSLAMAVPRSRIVDLMKVCSRPYHPARTQALTDDRSNVASSAPSSTQPASVSVTRFCANVCAVLRSLHTTLDGSPHSRTCRSCTLVSRPTTNSRRTDWSTCRSRRAEERERPRRRGQQQVRLCEKYRFWQSQCMRY
jgi:hypothetical protein